MPDAFDFPMPIDAPEDGGAEALVGLTSPFGGSSGFPLLVGDQAPSPSPGPPPASGSSNAQAPASGKLAALRYPNAAPVVDPNTRAPYPTPPGMDVARNVGQGASLAPFANMWTPDGPIDGRAVPMFLWFRHGGSMDYQRPRGYFAARLFGDYNGNLRNVTNYNFGAVAAAAGYSREEALSAAGLYNRWFGRPKSTDTKWGIDTDAVDNIRQAGRIFGRVYGERDNRAPLDARQAARRMGLLDHDPSPRPAAGRLHRPLRNARDRIDRRIAVARWALERNFAMEDLR